MNPNRRQITSTPIYYDIPPETRSFWCGHLPHWDVIGRPIFLTLHLRGAIPSRAADRIRARAERLNDLHDNDFTHRLKIVFKEMESWLDHAKYATYLRQPSIAAMIGEALAERQNRHWWRLMSWVLMPSHLHLLYVSGNVGMKACLTDFKRWTGHQANKLLGREGAKFWQNEWFDHWSRSAEETIRIMSYIRNNPVKAGLVKQADEWPHGSWAVM